MLIPTVCPIDGTDEYDVEVYPANFDPSNLDSGIFSARRSPDRIHYRMVRSRKSACLRANPILDPQVVRGLYETSHVRYDDLITFVTDTYLRYAERVWRVLPDKRGVLEVGCGSGHFLSQMTKRGFERVLGVELSADAIDKAPMEMQGRIVEGSIDDIQLEPGSFSLIAGFQVLDHIADPNRVLQKCRTALCEGGVMYWICHDIGSLLARILGERCPIVDIQHTVLYDKQTIAALFIQNGFEVLDQFPVANRYPLGYWTKLAPIPDPVKSSLMRLLNAVRMNRWPVSGYFGNMGIVARKPTA